jgi:hypothetical protein
VRWLGRTRRGREGAWAAWLGEASAKSRVILALLLPLALGSALPAAASGPAVLVRFYEAYSRTGAAPHLGRLELGPTWARLPALRGGMELEAAGTMPGEAGFELAGAAVHRVANADAYLALNGGEGTCGGEPARWLAVRDLGRGGPGETVRVGFLSVRDWRDYRQDRPGLCSGTS